MEHVDWVQLGIFITVIAIGFGVTKQKIADLTTRIKDIEHESDRIGSNKSSIDSLRDRVGILESDSKTLKDTHMSLQLAVARMPSKDDTDSLKKEMQTLGMSIVRLEVILEHLAAKQGIKIEKNGGT